MKKYRLLNKFLLLSMGVGMCTAFTACSSDNDEPVSPAEQPQETLEPGVRAITGDDGYVYYLDEADFVENVTETGNVGYDETQKAWFIQVLPPELKQALEENGYIIDDIGSTRYMTYAMPEEFRKPGLEVAFTGDAYDYHFYTNEDGHYSFIGGYNYYYLDIKEIK